MFDDSVNPYDGTAAMVVPQNIEKIPLFHWRPGARSLSVGSRDGASFSGILPDDEQRTFRRTVSPDLIAGAAHKVGIDTWSASWTASLRYPHGLDQLFQSGLAYSVVCTAGYGEASCLSNALDSGVDAWSVLIDASADPAPLLSTILQHGRHVEISLGVSDHLNEALFAAINWSNVSAVHLVPLKTTLAVGLLLQGWEEHTRSFIPDGIITYDSRHQNTRCQQCGEELVWRSNGRSRLGAIDLESNCCSECGHPTPITSF